MVGMRNLPDEEVVTNNEVSRQALHQGKVDASNPYVPWCTLRNIFFVDKQSIECTFTYLQLVGLKLHLGLICQAIPILFSCFVCGIPRLAQRFPRH
jgi:hypothetical protein